MNKESLFEKYLHGEMDDLEFNEFKSQLDSNEALRQEFRIHEVMYTDRANRIKAELQIGKIETQDHDNTSKPSSFHWFRRIAAAFVIVFAALFVINYFINKDGQNADLVRQYVSEKHLPPSVEMGETSEIGPWQLAIEAYRNGEFDLAIDQLKLIKNRSDEQNLYDGLSHIYAETPQYKKALLIFEKISENDSIAQDEALWYSSLLYLLLDNQEKASQSLNKIITTQSWRFKDAKKLLNQSK